MKFHLDTGMINVLKLLIKGEIDCSMSETLTCLPKIWSELFL